MRSISRSKLIVTTLALVFSLSHFGFLAGCSHNSSEPSAPTLGLTSPDKLLMPDPWPYAFEKHADISEFDAKRAQMIVGLPTLLACSSVIVTVPENGYTGAAIAVVLAIRPNDNWGVWYVDLDTNSRIAEATILSLDIETLAVRDEDTETIVTKGMIDDLAELEQNSDQVMLAALALNIDIEGKGLGEIWNRVKDAWNELSTCQQVHLVVGVVGCSFAGPFSLPCGAAVWVSSTFC